MVKVQMMVINLRLLIILSKQRWRSLGESPSHLLAHSQRRSYRDRARYARGWSAIEVYFIRYNHEPNVHIDIVVAYRLDDCVNIYAAGFEYRLMSIRQSDAVNEIVP